MKLTSDSKPTVLVLLAAYNGNDFIEEQLESIIAQKNVKISLTISVDKSSDNTIEIVNTYRNKYDFIEVLPYGYKLGSAGKNFFHLIKNSNISDFDFIAFADQDDIWSDQKIIRAINFLSENDADGYSSNVTAFWEDGRTDLVKKNYPQAKYDYLFESPGPGCSFVMSHKLFSSIKTQIVKKYDTKHLPWLHDWYCYSFARFNDYKWVIDDNSYMLYRQHDSNQVGANSGGQALLSRVKVMLKGDGLYEVLKQANFIEQNSELPIKYLSQGRLGALKLAIISFSLRRKFSHKIYCTFYFLILCIIGMEFEESF